MNKFKVKSTQILIFNQVFVQPYDVYYILKIHNHRAFYRYTGVKCSWKSMQILHSGTLHFPPYHRCMAYVTNVDPGSYGTSAAVHCWTSAAVYVYHMWRFDIRWRASVPPYKMSFLKTEVVFLPCENRSEKQYSDAYKYFWSWLLILLKSYNQNM